ncbi:NACHT, LRR and PYD domains-containing protein 3 [Trichomycterus rosablanca]|uniref:NACHT, LRR and PYD domains-containing protein 3 n=1 Tax=Trichomycterus rosablanca TaxID=2290929 RepID=UPI002F3542BC
MEGNAEVLHDLQTLHKNALRNDLFRSTRSSSLLGGQSSKDVIVNGSYAPLLVSISKRSREPFESVIQREFAVDAEGPKLVLCGGPGMGKTVAVEKLIWDWTCGTHLQHYTLVVRLCARALGGTEASLETVLLETCGQLGADRLELVLNQPDTLLLVLDGFDQLQDLLPDQRSSTPLVSDPKLPAGGAVLVHSLLEGSLLPGVSLLLTCRETFPLESVRCVRLLGFSDSQRRTFFQQYFKDLDEAETILQRCQRAVGMGELLACPAFCWMLCCICRTSVERHGSVPESLSELFCMVVNTVLQEHRVTPETGKKLLYSLGTLAEQGTSLTHTQSELINCSLRPYLGPPLLSAFLHVDHNDAKFSFPSSALKDFLHAVSFYLDQDDAEIPAGHPELYYTFLAGLSDPAQRRLLEVSLGSFNSRRLSEFQRWLMGSVAEVLPGTDRSDHFRVLRLLHHSLSPTLVRGSVGSCAWRLIGYKGMDETDCAALAFTVRCLGELESLNLYGSALTEEQAEKLTIAFHLAESINLTQSQINVDVMKHLAPATRGGRTTVLDLSYSKLGEESFRILCSSLVFSNLHTLNLWNCDLTPECSAALSDLLSGSKLRVLNLGGNEMKDEGIIQLAGALGASTCPLQELSVESCSLGVGCVTPLCSMLIGSLTELQKLHLGRNNLSHAHLELLSHTLQSNRTKLHTLSLYSCDLTASCCSSIADALQSSNCVLTELDLSVNDLHDSGALIICEALRSPHCFLEKLSLTRCEMTERVFSAVGSVLVSGVSRLKELDLGLNRVGDAGAKHIWRALKHPHCQLQHLDLEMLMLTDACMDELCDAVTSCSTLQSLILKNNCLTDVSVPRLVGLVEKRPVLELNVQYNDFSEDVFEMMDRFDTIQY